MKLAIIGGGVRTPLFLEGLTPGVGDIFNVGFITGYLAGESLERCLMYGNICGGLSTRGYGAAAVPTRSHLNEAMARYV